MRPQNTYSYSLTEILSYGYQYLASLFDSLLMKTLIATVLTFITANFYGDIALLYLWLNLAMFDLILGVIVALRNHTFQIKKLGLWVIKITTYMGCILLVSNLTQHLYLILQNIVPISDTYVAFIVNITMYIIMLKEVTSLIKNAEALKLPVPDVIHTLVAKLNDITQKLFNNKLDDLTKPIEKNKRNNR